MGAVFIFNKSIARNVAMGRIVLSLASRFPLTLQSPSQCLTLLCAFAVLTEINYMPSKQ